MTDQPRDAAETGAGASPPRALDVADARVQQLRRIIREHSLLIGDFTLTSGRKSSYLFQLRAATMHPQGAALIGELMVEFMRARDLRNIGGLEMGAVPVVAAVAVKSHDMGWPVRAFFMRKKAKEHGARQLFDGWLPEREGEEVLIIDDVTTTGGSLLKPVEKMREMGFVVRRALSIVDREEGALENLRQHGIELFSILRKSDFADALAQS